MRIDRKIIDDLNTKTHPKEKAKFQPITVEGQTPFYTPDTTKKTPIEATKTPEKTESAQTGTGTVGMPTYTKKDHTSYMYDATTDKAYTEALAALQAARANMPTYKNSYDADIEAIYNEIVGREDFRYDINEDALYHQYADQYQRLGKLAMMDTMGQAAIMTGGYGNSYANTAGNQAYQLYLGELNKVVPELYGMAHDRYTAEGEEMLDQYGMLLDRADDEYSKYLAELDQYWKNVSYLGGEADKAYDRGRENFYAAQELAAAEAEREAEFNAYYQQLLSNGNGTSGETSDDPGTDGNTGGTYTDTLWYATGTYDDNENPIFRNSEGKTQAFGQGVNPYTGTKNADAKNGTFSNGYQPNNIGGTKLQDSGMSTNITGKNQTIWQANGKYWLWRGDLNKYVEVDVSDLD